MPNISALTIYLSKIVEDSALQPGARGARKLIVTELYEHSEEEATQVEWAERADSGKCPIHVMNNTELAVFTQDAKQDRHLHSTATEIYLLQKGQMVIDVEGTEYKLFPGDFSIIYPGSTHEVKPANTEFLCYVLTVNCAPGGADKIVVD